jgi:uncharacterized protein YoxC
MNMDLERAERLSFLQIDEQTQRLTRGFKPTLAAHVRRILDGFYKHVGSVPQLGAMVGDDSNVARLKELQTRHWQSLFEARFDSGYMQQITRIGEMHMKNGLEPRWYIGGYCFVLNQVVEAAIRQNLWRPWRLLSLLPAINKVIFLDMELAISVYNDATQRHALTHLENTNQSLSRLSGSMQDIGGSAEAMSTSVNTIASAIEEMSASLLEVAKGAGQAASIAQKAEFNAGKTREIVDHLGTAAKEIGKVIDVINSIASQTNLLAINATIEAASAGDAGKGFAVVANEVKELAKQSASATDDIRTRIDVIQASTTAAVNAITEISEIIGELNHINNSIASAVEEQTATTNEISNSMSGAALAARTVSGSVNHVGETVEEIVHFVHEASMSFHNAREQE